MHPSLNELLDNLQHGLLWVSWEGVVRHANTQAGRRTGLSTGRKLFDPDLTKAVADVVRMQSPKVVSAVGVASAPGQAPAELHCRVIPGLANDDAFVLITQDAEADGKVGFDNLMQVIRSDLRDPFKAAHAGLALARTERDGAALDAALDKADDLLKAMDKLIALASIWSSQALLATDRIELWPLIQRCWSEVEPMALDRGVKARFVAQGEVGSLATLYGSEEWLGRVLQECMESAVRSAPKGGTLEIEHRQMGPRAMIVFRDCGVFARVVAGAVHMGDNTKAADSAPRAPAREDIGFRLCQHIVSLHGGQLREEDDDGIRNFLIDLPTGAPYNTDSSQLDIAQAQQYAKDLAALMARSRRKIAPGAARASTAGEPS